MGYDTTEIYEFARFEVEDAIVSGREIREGIENGSFTGWDDPQLMTLRALRRRGLQPEAIKEFVLATGLSKTEAKRPIDELYQANYDVVNDDASNALFVEAGVDVTVGDRVVHVHSEAASSLDEGETYETWDGFSFRCTGSSSGERVTEADSSLDGVTESKSRHASLVMPDGSRREGDFFVNGDYENDRIVRIKHVGFARIDDTAANTLWFAH
jgi:glutamyl/glutaminyl-tRNA synthetase